MNSETPSSSRHSVNQASHSPLKIALVCDHFLPRIGGIETHVKNLAIQLQRKGQEVRIITAFPGPDSVEGIPVYRMNTPLLPLAHSIFLPNFLAELKRILAAENFEVLHCHSSIFSPLAYGTAWLGIQNKIPTVLTNHSLFSLGSISCFRLWNLFSKLQQSPLVISSVSHEGAKRLRQALPKADVSVLPNGVFLDHWHASPTQHEGIRIVSVGRLHRKKNPLALIRAIPRVQEMVGTQRLHFTFIGDGHLMTKARQLADRLQVSHLVEFLGYLSPPQIREVFQKSDIFALSSSWETMPISLLEAGAAGLSVVAMNKGGVPDIIESGKNGLLAENPEQFCEHLATLIRDSDLRAKMAKEAELNCKKFSWENILPKNFELYQLAQKKLVCETLSGTGNCNEETLPSQSHRGYGA